MLELRPLTHGNRKPSLDFLKACAASSGSVAPRPMAQFKSASGVVAYKDGKICGLSCIYPTVIAGVFESGSTCTVKVDGVSGIGRAVLGGAVNNHFIVHAGKDTRIVADVFADNVAILKLTQELGFTIQPSPAWYERKRAKKLSVRQLKRGFHFIELTEHNYLATRPSPMAA